MTKETKMTSSSAEESFEYTPQRALLLSYDLNILIKKHFLPAQKEGGDKQDFRDIADLVSPVYPMKTQG